MKQELTGNSRYAAGSADVLAETFGDEIVAIQMKTGRYYSLRGIGRAIWQDLEAGYSPDGIKATVAAVDGASDLETAVVTFMGRLVEETLVAPVDEPARVGEAPASAAAAQARETLYDLEVYDDMADLLQADPIHEVDEETGWPAPRPVDQP